MSLFLVDQNEDCQLVILMLYHVFFMLENEGLLRAADIGCVSGSPILPMSFSALFSKLA